MTTLQILGSAGYHPSESRHTVCAYLPEYGVVLDAGTGIVNIRDRIKTRHIDIFLSSLGLDSSAGVYLLPQILSGTAIWARVWTLREQTNALREKFFGAPFSGQECWPYETGVVWPETRYLITRSGRTPELQTFGMRARELFRVPTITLGYRFTFGGEKILAYVPDFVSPNIYQDLVAGADLLLLPHETNPWRFDEAKKVGVKKILLTKICEYLHKTPLPPEWADYVTIAEDNMEVEF